MQWPDGRFNIIVDCSSLIIMVEAQGETKPLEQRARKHDSLFSPKGPRGTVITRNVTHYMMIAPL